MFTAKFLSCLDGATRAAMLDEPRFWCQAISDTDWGTLVGACAATAAISVAATSLAWWAWSRRTSRLEGNGGAADELGAGNQTPNRPQRPVRRFNLMDIIRRGDSQPRPLIGSPDSAGQQSPGPQLLGLDDTVHVGGLGNASNFVDELLEAVEDEQQEQEQEEQRDQTPPPPGAEEDNL